MRKRDASHETVPPHEPSGVTEQEARGIVMAFSEAVPMFVPPRLYRDLEARGFLDDPEMRKRIRVTPTLPLA